MTPHWLPDWQNKSQYPVLGKTSHQQWAWQFLRRNSNYQRLWDRIIDGNYNSDFVAWEASLFKKRRGLFHVWLFEHYFRNPDLRIFVDKFKIVSTPPDPAEPNATPVFLGNVIRYALPQSRQLPMRALTKLADSEILVWLDSNQRIDPQLQATKILLAQRAKITKKNKFHAAPKACQKYLRLLDAKACGASNSQIAKIIYPQLSNAYVRARPAGRQIRGDFNIAKKLRDQNFWQIAAAGQ